MITNQQDIINKQVQDQERKKAINRPKITEFKYRFRKPDLNDQHYEYTAFVAANTFEDAEREFYHHLGPAHREHVHVTYQDAQACRLDAIARPLRFKLYKLWKKEFEETPKLSDRLKR